MQELITMLAGIMSREDLSKQLNDSLQKYQMDPSEENWQQLSIFCVMVISKSNTEILSDDPLTGVQKQLDHIKKIQGAHDLLNPKKQ